MERPCKVLYGKYGAELMEASMRLLRQLDREQIIESMFDFMEKNGNTQHLAFYLFETEGARLAAGRGESKPVAGRLCVAESGIFGEVRRTGKSWAGRNDAEADESVRASMVLPVKNGDKVVGALRLAYEDAGQCPGGERLWLLEQYAAWAGIAYENARIFEEQRQELHRRRQLEAEIRHMAYHDALTGLPNRRLLEDRLNVAISQARRFDEIVAVMFLDLDSMKRINDSYGHEAGDLLLESVAARLRSVVRDIDTVARISGDEFVLVLPRQENRLMTGELADRILAAIRSRFDLGAAASIGITASIGIAFFPEDGKDYATLLRSADKAMYLAKQMGRDQWVFASGNAVKT